MACCHLLARIRSPTARVPANRIAAAAVTPAHMSAAVTASTPARCRGSVRRSARPCHRPRSRRIAGLGRRLCHDRAGVFGPAVDHRAAMVAVVREMFWAAVSSVIVAVTR